MSNTYLTITSKCRNMKLVHIYCINCVFKDDYIQYRWNSDALNISFPNSRIIQTNVRSEGSESGSADQRYILKCNCCLWKTSYVDITGNLHLPDNSILCPRCRIGLIEVEARVNKNVFILPAYLDYVLSD